MHRSLTGSPLLPSGLPLLQQRAIVLHLDLELLHYLRHLWLQHVCWPVGLQHGDLLDGCHGLWTESDNAGGDVCTRNREVVTTVTDGWLAAR